MKYVFLILFLPNLVFAKCHVTSSFDQKGERLIRCVGGFVPADRIHDAPLDSNGNVVKNGALIELESGQTLFDKIAAFIGFGDEKYKPKYIYSPTKAAVIAQQKADKLKIQKDVRDAKNDRLNAIKAACPGLTGINKLMCEHIVNE